ncbi:MAG: hypothetical protein KDK66_07355 [Deltaproteobacteria bacterium]|nr:hypothetical protein [Deltaproteobacteria bacterium]
MKKAPLVFLMVFLFALPAWAVERCDHGVNFANGSTYKNYTGPVTCRDKDTGKITRTIELKSGKRHGVYRFYNPIKGHLSLEEFYLDGKRHGLRTEYNYEDGKLQAEIPYEAGEKKGVSKSYYPSGRLRSLTANQPGRKGTSVSYNPQGQLMKLRCAELSVVPEDRKWCGFTSQSVAVKLYTHQGKLKEIRRYRKGKSHGRQEFYHNDGKLSSVRYYQDGKPTSDRENYNKDGKMIESYVKKDGVYQEFYSQGLLKREVFFTKDKQPEREIYYYQNGHKKKELEYLGKSLVVERDYYDSGILSASGKLKFLDQEETMPIGTWKYYREDSSLDFEAVYEEGKIAEKHLYDELGELEKTEAFYPDGSKKYEKIHRTKVSY